MRGCRENPPFSYRSKTEVYYEKITWQVQYFFSRGYPRHCKKCGKTTKFSCSEKFRVKCPDGGPWTYGLFIIVWTAIHNGTPEFTPIFPRSHSHPEELEGFQGNSHSLAEEYAMDTGFLSKNGVDEIEARLLHYGEEFLPAKCRAYDQEASICSNKVSALIRKKLHLSQAAYLQMIENGTIKSIPEQDLRNVKLKNTITLFFQMKA